MQHQHLQPSLTILPYSQTCINNFKGSDMISKHQRGQKITGEGKRIIDRIGVCQARRCPVWRHCGMWQRRSRNSVDFQKNLICRILEQWSNKKLIMTGSFLIFSRLIIIAYLNHKISELCKTPAPFFCHRSSSNSSFHPHKLHWTLEERAKVF